MRSRQEKKTSKVTLIGAFAGFGLIGFFFLGLPELMPPSWKLAHEEKVFSHYHITVDTDGIIPANIGIDEELWHYHELDHLGVNGWAPIHTHDTSGVFHIETKENHAFTLGDLIAIWGVDVDSACIKTVGGLCSDLEYIERTPIREGDQFRLVLSQ